MATALAKSSMHQQGRRAKGTNTAWLYERLRRAILSLSIPPGENLEEKELVQRFGISRTPVREALIRLAADGLVVLLPNRGARVAAIDLGDFPRYVEAYDLIQRAATRLAAQRRDHDDLVKIKDAQARFEKAINSASGNISQVQGS
jgi:DNA-binding GntR family transcriptional regulator